MHRLRGRIQPYTWGGNNFIPDLFHIQTDRSTPAAEIWLGAHPGGITEIELTDGVWKSLASVIQEDKVKWLGEQVSNEFRRLPFLLKVLDVKDMLSIQVHPSKSAAEKGFALENEHGVPFDASHRNYKDDNHKPEVMIALSEFWLLHGFANDIEQRLDTYAFLAPFKKDFQEGGIKQLYKTLMELDQQQVNDILRPLALSIIQPYQEGKLDKSSPDFWAARAFENLCTDGKYDKGIFSIYLFNILRLMPGEGIFQGAGMPHAYLEGQNIELMSNSDNVLRAGLTPKHIDIPELLKNTLFNVTIPEIIKVRQGAETQHYECPVEDFAIAAYHISSSSSKTFTCSNPAIVLFTKGEAIISGNVEHNVTSAAAYYCLPGESFKMEAISDVDVVIATVP